MKKEFVVPMIEELPISNTQYNYADGVEPDGHFEDNDGNILFYLYQYSSSAK